ncbi:MAG: ABC transporter permease subunit [Dehalococcoidales bacterium]
MISMIRGEIIKTVRRRTTWVLLAVMVVYFNIIFFAIYGVVDSPPRQMSPDIIAQISDSLQFPGAFNTIFSTARTIGTLLVIVLTASSIGSEFSWGSIRQILTRKGIRYHFVVSKLVSLVLFTTIGLLIALVTGFGLSIITDNLLGSIEWNFMTVGFAGEIAITFGWTLFGLLPYIALAAFFSFLGRSAISGIGGALGIYVIETVLVTIFNSSGGWLAKIPQYLLGPNIDALVPATLFSQSPFWVASELPGTLHAAIALTIYCVVLIGTSLAIFQKRDVLLG